MKMMPHPHTVAYSINKKPRESSVVCLARFLTPKPQQSLFPFSYVAACLAILVIYGPPVPGPSSQIRSSHSLLPPYLHLGIYTNNHQPT